MSELLAKIVVGSVGRRDAVEEMLPVTKYAYYH